jgi:hypothetical protein
VTKRLGIQDAGAGMHHLVEALGVVQIDASSQGCKRERNSGKVDPVEIGSREIRFREIRAFEIGSLQVTVGEIREG